MAPAPGRQVEAGRARAGWRAGRGWPPLSPHPGHQPGCFFPHDAPRRRVGEKARATGCDRAPATKAPRAGFDFATTPQPISFVLLLRVVAVSCEVKTRWPSTATGPRGPDDQWGPGRLGERCVAARLAAASRDDANTGAHPS
jgi:hypothetical protein